MKGTVHLEGLFFSLEAIKREKNREAGSFACQSFLWKLESDRGSSRQTLVHQSRQSICRARSVFPQLWCSAIWSQLAHTNTNTHSWWRVRVGEMCTCCPVDKNTPKWCWNLFLNIEKLPSGVRTWVLYKASGSWQIVYQLASKQSTRRKTEVCTATYTCSV